MILCDTEGRNRGGEGGDGGQLEMVLTWPHLCAPFWYYYESNFGGEAINLLNRTNSINFETPALSSRALKLPYILATDIGFPPRVTPPPYTLLHIGAKRTDQSVYKDTVNNVETRDKNNRGG